MLFRRPYVYPPSWCAMFARNRFAVLLISLLAVCAIVYMPGMYGPFLFDDFPNLAALASIDHVASWRDLGIYLSQPRSFPGRPLAMLSFLPQKASWPDHPFPFKLINLGLHLLCGALVYRLATVLARHYAGAHSRDEASAARTVGIAALLATAAWLLNPIHISGVMMVVQRMTLLMSLFTLLGLLAYLHGLLAENALARRRGVWMALGLGACMLLAFLSKENGLLLPLYALVLDATLLRASVTRLPRYLQWWRRLLIWPPVLFLFAYLLFSALQFSQASNTRDFTLGERLLTEPRILFGYLRDIFLPRFGLYGMFHDDYLVSRSLLSPWSTFFSMGGVLGAAAVGFIARRRWPLLAMAILWYLGGQLLESSTVMLELYFEHRNYVPVIGPFIAIAIGLSRVAKPVSRKRLLGLAALWLAACAVTTSLTTNVYGSADRLSLAWAAQQPDSIRAQTALADRLYHHGQIATALSVFERVQEKFPNNTGVAENLVYLECMQGTLTPSKVQALATMLRSAPFDRGGFENLENLRLTATNQRCAALGTTQWRALAQALLANPHYAGIASGYTHYQLHLLAVAEGNLGNAIRELDAAYAVDPDAEIPRLQAKYLASAGLYDQAIKTLQDTDYSRLPLLRRLLVNDRAINDSDIQLLEQQKKARVPAVKAMPATATTHTP